MKGVKHYTEDGEYDGPTHKMDGEVHTGAKHSESSKVISHKKGGPFKMNATPFHKSKGLWANIHAKRKRGEINGRFNYVDYYNSNRCFNSSSFNPHP